MVQPAYRDGEATIIAPPEFTRIPLAAPIGLTLFAEVPDLWPLAGAVAIVSAANTISRIGTAKFRISKPT